MASRLRLYAAAADRCRLAKFHDPPWAEQIQLRCGQEACSVALPLPLRLSLRTFCWGFRWLPCASRGCTLRSLRRGLSRVGSPALYTPGLAVRDSNLYARDIAEALELLSGRLGDSAASAVGPVRKVHKGAAPSLESESNRAQRRAGGGGFGSLGGWTRPQSPQGCSPVTRVRVQQGAEARRKWGIRQPGRLDPSAKSTSVQPRQSPTGRRGEPEVGDFIAWAVGPVCKVHKGAAPSESDRAQRRAGGGGFGSLGGWTRVPRVHPAVELVGRLPDPVSVGKSSRH
jgi:hypothetical protein